MYYPETRYARSKEGHVAYQVVGDGPLDLVFIPSWLCNVDVMWEEPSLAGFLRRLASFSRLICFDKRGAGVSDTVSLAALPTLEQWSDDVRTVMEATGSKRVALLGHGPGGQMAMLFAATYPELTSALILIDSAARRLRDCDYPWGLPANQLPLRLERIEELWGTGGNLDFIAPSVAREERFRRWYARFERLAMGPRAARAIIASGLEGDLRSILPAIRVPTLVLHRAGDPFIRIGLGRYLAEHIQGAKFVELPGEDHLLYVGETEAMLGEIEHFLTGRPRSVQSQAAPMTLDTIIHIIDDDSAMRESLSLMLRTEGYTVRTHESAQTFLDAVGQDESGCVVTDVRMPEISGIDLLTTMKMKERCVSMPVIVITGHADVQLAVQAMKEGAFDFLEKPFDGDALLASVRKALIRSNDEHARDAEMRIIQSRLAKLTPRENEVLAGLLKGQHNKIIAGELGIGLRTVEAHRASVMAKMRAGSLSELVRMALVIPRMRE